MNFAYVAPERDDADIKLDWLLAAWHEWRRGLRYAERAHRAATVTNNYRAPGHHDWSNGAADAKADEMVNKQIDQSVQRLPNEPHRWRTAIEFEARNLSTGHSVWRSPYLPADQEELAVLILEARSKLMLELRRDGVMT
jgi:hypothetical protein